MKSAVLTGIRKIEVREVPDPQLRNETDVLLKIGVVGLCGSDIHYYLAQQTSNQIVQYPPHHLQSPAAQWGYCYQH